MTNTGKKSSQRRQVRINFSKSSSENDIQRNMEGPHCFHCQEHLGPFCEFGKVLLCEGCNSLYMRASKYGLRPKEYRKLWLFQNKKCALCPKAEPLVIDHCHFTGRVRGLLCISCNNMISEKLQENLEEIVKYIVQGGTARLLGINYNKEDKPKNRRPKRMTLASMCQYFQDNPLPPGWHDK